MELSQIRYFLDAASTQHITKSAERLHISQPALTKSIRNLEDELGVPLFTHKGRNIVLTYYGEYLREKLSPIIDSLDSLSVELAGMTEEETKTLRLRVSAASTVVTEAIIAYKRQNPEVKFHVVQNSESVLYDIEVTTNPVMETEDTRDVFVCTENIYLAVPNSGDYARRCSISLREVSAEGFVSLFGSRQIRNMCDKYCMSAGFEPRIVFESDSPDAVKNMIGSSIGIGFWPEFTWGDINSDHVKLLPISDPICKRDIVVSYRDVKTDNTYARGFYDFLCEFLKKKNSR